MIDTHCHLTFDELFSRIDAVLRSAADHGVDRMITVATTTENATESLALARAHPNVFCTAGVHPLYADQPYDWSVLAEVGSDPNCVAWGELGLDAHYDHPPFDLQISVLEAQLAELQSLDVATDAGRSKPIVIHCRKAVEPLLAILRSSTFDPASFVFHCFTGTPEDARLVLDFGAMISFTGIVTFRNATEIAKASDLVPLDRLMVETDAPFLTPEPHRTTRPNEPKFVVCVAEYLAQRRGIALSDFIAAVDANAERFFRLPPPDSPTPAHSLR